MNQKKCICITGGASGMGLETGLFFSRKGWLVGLLDRDLSLLNEAALLFAADTVFINQVDVTSPENLKHAMNSFGDFSGGQLDIMFNNAGIASHIIFCFSQTFFWLGVKGEHTTKNLN